MPLGTTLMSISLYVYADIIWNQSYINKTIQLVIIFLLKIKQNDENIVCIT